MEKDPKRLDKVSTSRSELMKESKNDAVRKLTMPMYDPKRKTSTEKHIVHVKIPPVEHQYTYRFLKCGKCDREVLVETLLCGTDHTASIIVTCKECLKKSPLPKEFIAKYPEQAKAIQEWLTS